MLGCMCFYELRFPVNILPGVGLPDYMAMCNLLRNVCRSGSKLEQDMEKQTSSKSGKEYVKAIYCHPAYLTYMQSTS